MRKLLSKIKEKRGSNTIEYAIALLIFVLLFAFFVDLALITWKFVVTSQVANSSIKILDVQSGVTTTIPSGFPGNKGYVTSSELYNNIQKKLKDAANIEDFTVTLKGYDKNGGGTSTTVLGPNTQFKVDYRGRIQMEIQVKYRWGFTKIIPGLDAEKNIVAVRSGITEFKYNYDKWIGEEE